MSSPSCRSNLSHEERDGRNTVRKRRPESRTLRSRIPAFLRSLRGDMIPLCHNDAIAWIRSLWPHCLYRFVAEIRVGTDCFSPYPRWVIVRTLRVKHWSLSIVLADIAYATLNILRRGRGVVI
ncbi:hypothetical protein A0H81_06675 [Grifola frondosa]|uniref:Uncharacterized protein n=1 Tax=Grifola frondosa TaxID=5627 RepID=A0A1C7MDM3_GRIFR|nr:hypothetical protein A0H81_06675 [Grifola frondosa]